MFEDKEKQTTFKALLWKHGDYIKPKIIALIEIFRECIPGSIKENLKIPSPDFVIKMKNDKKCCIIPMVSRKIDIKNEKDHEKPSSENLCVIGRSLKAKETCLLAPVWDYYIFVSLSLPIINDCVSINNCVNLNDCNPFIMGYLSNKDLLPSKICREKGEMLIERNKTIVELTAWKFNASELRPFSEIKNLITSDLVVAPPLFSI